MRHPKGYRIFKTLLDYLRWRIGGLSFHLHCEFAVSLSEL